MISFNEAFDIVMRQARVLESERVPLDAASNRILAEDVLSDMDMPPFDKSAMDGFACRREDLPGVLTVIESVQAGYLPTKPVGRNQCCRIMTGAKVPEAADCVIMLEHTEQISENTVRFAEKATGKNICPRGEDFRAGEVVLRKGDRIQAQHVAVLASVGCTKPFVSRRPRVGIIATGDELVEPEAVPGPGQIRSSNSHQLRVQIEATGAVATCYGISRDSEAAVEALLKKALSENDVVLVSAGVSKGDFDFVPLVLKKNNIKVLFDAIAVKPGKPTTFGVGPSVYCFGLPGNPVATFVQCELLVKPFLYALMGHQYRPPHSWLTLSETFQRKRADREEWSPVEYVAEGAVRPCAHHGSAHVCALCNACGLICVPLGTSVIEKGTIVRVRPI
jgi:molybdopterin molybdotransferase